MADGTHWPGTWLDSAPDHGKGDHASIVQVCIINDHSNFVIIILARTQMYGS
jgi:hypothetical protein